MFVYSSYNSKRFIEKYLELFSSLLQTLRVVFSECAGLIKDVRALKIAASSSPISFFW
jgi:hypothetical protein